MLPLKRIKGNFYCIREQTTQLRQKCAKLPAAPMVTKIQKDNINRDYQPFRSLIITMQYSAL